MLLVIEGTRNALFFALTFFLENVVDFPIKLSQHRSRWSKSSKMFSEFVYCHKQRQMSHRMHHTACRGSGNDKCSIYFYGSPSWDKKDEENGSERNCALCSLITGLLSCVLCSIKQVPVRQDISNEIYLFYSDKTELFHNQPEH